MNHPYVIVSDGAVTATSSETHVWDIDRLTDPNTDGEKVAAALDAMGRVLASVEPDDAVPLRRAATEVWHALAARKQVDRPARGRHTRPDGIDGRTATFDVDVQIWHEDPAGQVRAVARTVMVATTARPHEDRFALDVAAVVAANMSRSGPLRKVEVVRARH